jgi:hypothetical protein
MLRAMVCSLKCSGNQAGISTLIMVEAVSGGVVVSREARERCVGRMMSNVMMLRARREALIKPASDAQSNFLMAATNMSIIVCRFARL